MSNTNAETIRRLYGALSTRDGESMAACYAPDATFQDRVFTLRGEAVGDMWRMLCARGKDLKVEFSDVHADANGGSAYWVATYTFSGTGRQVINRIRARFVFRDGLIAEHVDSFDLWRWARQALGPVGLLLGWSPMVRNKIRSQAGAALEAFSAERRKRLS
jgi:ketosteroid isomerase-like protein